MSGDANVSVAWEEIHLPECPWAGPEPEEACTCPNTPWGVHRPSAVADSDERSTCDHGTPLEDDCLACTLAPVASMLTPTTPEMTDEPVLTTPEMADEREPSLESDDLRVDDGLHTFECLVYAAKTRRSFCIVECTDARRKRAADPVPPRRPGKRGVPLPGETPLSAKARDGSVFGLNDILEDDAVVLFVTHYKDGSVSIVWQRPNGKSLLQTGLRCSGESDAWAMAAARQWYATDRGSGGSAEARLVSEVRKHAAHKCACTSAEECLSGIARIAESNSEGARDE